MSSVITALGLATGAGAAYQAYNQEDSPARSAAFGAAVVEILTTIAANANGSPVLQGLSQGVAPAAAVSNLVLSGIALAEADTPADALAGALGVLAGGAGALAGLIPPAALTPLSPQAIAAKAVLTAVAVAASAAQLAVQENSEDVNEKLNDIFEDGLLEKTRKLLVPGYSDERAIIDAVNEQWQRANTLAPRDPLAIDLDGDGVETVSINTASPILFDHNGDGVKTATGWLKGDDAWLVRDLNGNGLVDSGAELFGVDTDIVVGGVNRKAANGFEALAALDENLDGVFDAADAEFSHVRLWRDLNSNGISDVGETSSLAGYGILSIGLQVQPVSVDLGGGNSISGKGVVTRLSGTSEIDSVVVSVDSAANLNLAENPFYATLQPVLISNLASSLPDMQGSGMVRGLREAMSVGSASAVVLTQKVEFFVAATARSDQLAIIDDLIQAWGATSSMSTSSPFESVDGLVQEEFNPSAPLAGSIFSFAQNNQDLFEKVITLERFNGVLGLAPLIGSWGVSLRPQVVERLEASYEELRYSVFKSLSLQTRLKPYFDAVKLVFEGESVSIDSSGVLAMLNEKRGTDEVSAFLDLIDLARFSESSLRLYGLEAKALLAEWFSSLPSDSVLLQQDWRVLMGTSRNPGFPASSSGKSLIYMTPNGQKAGFREVP
ncbi:MAG: hypothetical protein ACK4K3_04875 [Aquabacterium sp.]